MYHKRWSDSMVYMVSCISFVMGLENFWLFSYLCHRNGGAAFLTAYVTCVFCVGSPIMLLELSLGQLAHAGVNDCWEFCPLFKGIGLAMTLHLVMMQSHMSVLLAWCVYYFFYSFRIDLDLPYEGCNDWERPECFRPYFERHMKYKCEVILGGTFQNHPCIGRGGDGINLERNGSLNGTTFFEEDVLGLTSAHNLTNLGYIRPKLVLCVALVWIVVLYFAKDGVRYVGKVVYFTVLFPSVMMSVMVCFGLALDGGLEAQVRFMQLDTKALGSRQVWLRALSHTLYSLSLGKGKLIMLASYNHNRNNVIGDTFLLVLLDICVNAIAAMAVLSLLGHLAFNMHIHVTDLLEPSGPYLVFGNFFSSLTMFWGRELWCAASYLMIICLGMGNHILSVAIVISIIVDAFPQCIFRKTAVSIGLCVCFFMLSLPMLTEGGKHLVDLIDNSLRSYSFATAGLECIAVAWCYGTSAFLSDVTTMIGGVGPWATPLKVLLTVSWCIICPAMCAVAFWHTTFVVKSYDNNNLELVTWFFNSLSTIIVTIIALVVLIKKRGTRALAPTDNWRPSLQMHLSHHLHIQGQDGWGLAWAEPTIHSPAAPERGYRLRLRSWLHSPNTRSQSQLVVTAASVGVEQATGSHPDSSVTATLKDLVESGVDQEDTIYIMPFEYSSYGQTSAFSDGTRTKSRDTKNNTQDEQSSV